MLCVVAAVLVLQELFLGGIAFIVGSVCDTLDGRYSRMSGKGTPFGAFLDSTLDRIEEGIVLDRGRRPVLAGRATTRRSPPCVVAVLASLMVSYTRARAEALGVECKVGIADRAVRVVILSAGLVFAKGAGSSTSSCSSRPSTCSPGCRSITVFQRIFHVRSELHERRRAVTRRLSRGLLSRTPSIRTTR